MLSGGVSQWITATKPADACDDLGERLALKTRDLLQDTGYTIRIANDPIRATVLGASQQRMQVSGNTVFISDERCCRSVTHQYLWLLCWRKTLIKRCHGVGKGIIIKGAF